MDRREFFKNLLSSVAPTVAVAVYPEASLGLLDRYFWKPVRKYFQPICATGGRVRVPTIKWEISSGTTLLNSSKIKFEILPMVDLLDEKDESKIKWEQIGVVAKEQVKKLFIRLEEYAFEEEQNIFLDF